MNKNKVYPKYMVFLPLVIFVIFFVIPSTFGYLYAFTDWSATRSGFSDIHFTGVQNLIDMITNRKVPVALGNTFIYAIIKTFVVTILGLALAYILNREIKSKNALRTLYFLPAVLSPLVVGLIFSAVFQTRGGTANEILKLFGADTVQWLGSRWTGVFAISFAEVWRNVGYAMVISLAGMQSVSSDYIEAAKIDGASEWQCYINITLPLIMPTVNVNILFSLIYGLKMFDLIYVMTGGGPGGSTESFGTLMLNEMGAGRYATSVAVNLIFTVILVAVAVLYKKFSERWEQAV
ncbi:sugar ABC transporter permease [uncultured Oscillibacter sp.]|uniref:carbohydrate ABC transporter permease n=1 Tax=uncultured Oscillibacter sp. TaxID=876091 RepID=UPI00261B5A0F|nr:sugar ABC transporter permease [uncultured Oscillibacter sp.]